jgi:hypothetical protein
MVIFDKKGALPVPKNTVHRERAGEASTKPYLLTAVDLVDSLLFVKAACSLGGDPFVVSSAKLST